MTEQNTAEKHYLSSRELLGEIISYGKLNWQPILKLMAVPFLICVGLEIGLRELTRGQVWWQVAIPLLYYIPQALFLVALHRRYLLKHEESIACGAREFRFLGYLLLVAIFPLSPTIVLAFLNIYVDHVGLTIFMLLSIIPAVYVIFRLALVFPIAAVDFPGSISDHVRTSWSTMKGNVGAVFGAVLAFGLIFAAIFGSLGLVVEYLPGDDLSRTIGYYIAVSIDIFSQFVGEACFVIVASYAFKTLVLSETAPEA